MENSIRVFITKYALADGITETDAELCDSRMIRVRKRGSHNFDQYFHGEGKDWHRTRESAVKRAETMRDKAIQSAEKKILKLKNLQF